MASITQISTGTSLGNASGTKITPNNTSTDKPETDPDKDNAKQLKNQFLSILLTQMQHQNPLDPMDTKEFTGQLTQFSALEQQIDTNAKLDNMLSALTKNTLSTAFNYIGQYVDLSTNQTVFQNNSADWTYAIPEDAKSVTVSVTDSAGKILYSANMVNGSGGSAINAGTYNIDLKNADFTRSVAEGEVLKVSVTAKNNANKAITAEVHTTVLVESVQSDDKGTYLQAGGMLFEIADVNKIMKPPAATPPPPSTPAATETATDTTDDTDTADDDTAQNADAA